MERFTKEEAALEKCSDALVKKINAALPVGSRVRVRWASGWMQGTIVGECHCGFRRTLIVDSDKAAGRLSGRHHKHYSDIELI